MKKLIFICIIMGMALPSCNFVHDLFMPHQTWRPGKPKKGNKPGKNYVIHKERLNSL